VESPGLLYQHKLRHAPALSSRQRALVVGAPSLTGRLAATLTPLDDAVQEAEEIASQFPSGTLLTSRQATLSAVQRELPHASVFHFAGHSVYTPEKIGLLLANSGPEDASPGETAVLDATTLASLPLREMQLAVLSACSTAKDGDLSADGSGTVAEVFLRGGVPHVVASRWNVDSVTTAELMRDFYRILLQGNPPAIALKVAADSVRRHNAHPYYWAAFNAFGRP